MKIKFVILLFFFTVFCFSQQRTVFDVSRNGTVEELKSLMKDNPDIINSINDRSFSTLILACYNGNVEVAKFLIDHVKDINYISKEGTALAGLCIRYNPEITEYLLKNNANPNLADARGTTPLIWAVQSGNEDLIVLLLKYNAKTDQADNLGLTPFEYALKTNKTNIINLLKTK